METASTFETILSIKLYVTNVKRSGKKCSSFLQCYYQSQHGRHYTKIRALRLFPAVGGALAVATEHIFDNVYFTHADNWEGPSSHN